MADRFAQTTLDTASRRGALAARDLNYWNLLRVVIAVLAPPNLGVDGALATSGCDRRRTCRLAAGSEPVEGASWLFAPKSVLIVVVVKHFVTLRRDPPRPNRPPR